VRSILYPTLFVTWSCLPVTRRPSGSQNSFAPEIQAVLKSTSTARLNMSNLDQLFGGASAIIIAGDGFLLLLSKFSELNQAQPEFSAHTCNHQRFRDSPPEVDALRIVTSPAVIRRYEHFDFPYQFY
jgi:hypothetical protein